VVGKEVSLNHLPQKLDGNIILSPDLHPTFKDLVPSVANVIVRKFKGWVDRDDVKQECYLWAIGRGQQFTDLLNEENPNKREQNEKRIAYQMRRVAERYARKEKASKAGYHISDEAFYDTTTIAQLIPFVIASVVDGTVLEQAQEMINDGQPRKQSTPAEGGNLLAILIDIKKSYLKLEQEDKTILQMRYHDNLTLQQIAQYLECATSTADRRCTSALRRLQDKLGGDTPWS
jgi:RNA polymerase sigma factor (sigma-70 family)